MGLLKDHGVTTLLITGGIGGGKSLAAKYLAEMGIPVYDFDARTKGLYDNDSDLCLKVAEAVRPYSGEDVLTADGHIIRPALARAVFGNPPALAALEAVVHPTVLEDFRVWCADQVRRFDEGAQGGTDGAAQLPIIVAESAIALSKPLFAAEFDKIIFISASEEVRKSRVVLRDGLTVSEVTARMQAQSPHFPASSSTPGFVSPKIDYIIENNGDRGELKEKLYGIIYKLTQK